MNIQDFSDLISTERLEKIVFSDSNLQLVSNLDLLSLRKVLYQYRFIVRDHAKHLSILLSRLPQGDLKTLLEEIYLEEIGDHNFQESHYYLYNSFLKSVGCSDFSISPLPQLKENLYQYDKALNNNSVSFAVGLAGMGTECICQIYLTELNNQLKSNSAIKSFGDQVDWKFMDLHVGDVDLSHRIRMRNNIMQFLANQGSDSINQLSQGYEFSLSFWNQLFSILCQDLLLKAS